MIKKITIFISILTFINLTVASIIPVSAAQISVIESFSEFEHPIYSIAFDKQFNPYVMEIDDTSETHHVTFSRIQADGSNEEILNTRFYAPKDVVFKDFAMFKNNVYFIVSHTEWDQYTNQDQKYLMLYYFNIKNPDVLYGSGFAINNYVAEVQIKTDLNGRIYVMTYDNAVELPSPQRTLYVFNPKRIKILEQKFDYHTEALRMDVDSKGRLYRVGESIQSDTTKDAYLYVSKPLNKKLAPKKILIAKESEGYIFKDLFVDAGKARTIFFSKENTTDSSQELISINTVDETSELITTEPNTIGSFVRLKDEKFALVTYSIDQDYRILRIFDAIDLTRAEEKYTDTIFYRGMVSDKNGNAYTVNYGSGGIFEFEELNSLTKVTLQN